MVAPIHAPVAPFTVEIHERDGVPVVVIGGEIDTSNDAEIGNAIGVQLEPRPSVVLIDLRKVRFLGSAGVRLLLKNHLHAQSNGTRFVVIADHRAVLRTLAIAQLDQSWSCTTGIPNCLTTALGRGCSVLRLCGEASAVTRRTALACSCC